MGKACYSQNLSNHPHRVFYDGLTYHLILWDKPKHSTGILVIKYAYIFCLPSERFFLCLFLNHQGISKIKSKKSALYNLKRFRHCPPLEYRQYFLMIVQTYYYFLSVFYILQPVYYIFKLYPSDNFTIIAPK